LGFSCKLLKSCGLREHAESPHKAGGAHSAISAAAAEVLRLSLGDPIALDVTSDSLAGITRHFTSFSEAAGEAGLSRIYAGQHFRFDHNAGKRLGRQVSDSVLSTILQPRRNLELE
jgi:hypothetical protein